MLASQITVHNNRHCSTHPTPVKMATQDAQTPPQLSEEKIKELFAASQEAKSRAYAPYSKFFVGAALLTTEGKVFQGSSVH